MVQDYKDTAQTVWKDTDYTRWVLSTGAEIPSAYSPTIRITIYLDGRTLRFAFIKDDYDSNHNYYKRTVLTCPEITTEMPDIFWGVEQVSDVTIELSAADNVVDDTWYEILAAEEVRGRWVKIERYDPTDGTNLEFRGKIDSIELSSTVRITIRSRDDEILDTLLPLHTVTTDLFTTTAVDLGAAVNICIGHCVNVPLRNIKNDLVNNHYDYLIGYGPIEGIWLDATHGVRCPNTTAQVKLVPAAEYTLLNNTVYPGYAVLRFTVEQRDHTLAFRQLTADVKGLTMGGATAERNFATVTKNILTNTSWGLSDNADADGFTTAASQLDAIGNMYCDMAITSQRMARDVLNEILPVARAALERGDDGEWEIQIDVAGAKVKSFGEVDGYHNNCEVLSISKTPAKQAIKNLTVQYAIDESNTDKPYYELSIAVNTGFGVDKTERLACVLEHDTAINVLSYKKNRSIYGDDKVSLRCGLEARLLRRGQIIGLTAPLKGISTEISLKIQRITKELSEFYLDCYSYDAHIYDTEVVVAPTAWTEPAITVAGPNSLVGNVVLGDGGTQPGRLTLQVAPGQGDTYINAGKTDFTNVQNGFILGLDDSDSDTAKFYIGNAQTYMNWTGSLLKLAIKGEDGFAVIDAADPSAVALPGELVFFASDTDTDLVLSTAHATYFPELTMHRSKGSHASPTILAEGDTAGRINFKYYDGTAFEKCGEIAAYAGPTPAEDDTPGNLRFRVTPEGSTTPATAIAIDSTGWVGVLTTNLSRVFETNQGSGNLITDGVDLHSLGIFKENVKKAGSVFENFKKVNLYQYRRTPHVSATELREAAVKRFGLDRWRAIYPDADSHRGGKLKNCPDQEIKAFLDALADRLRAERRELPEWKQERLGLVADDPTLENHPALIAKDKGGNIIGVSLSEQVGFVHGGLLGEIAEREALEKRVEILEKRIEDLENRWN